MRLVQHGGRAQEAAEPPARPSDHHLSVQNRAEPQSYLLLNGTATVTETGADAHADKLAKRFLGVDKYPYRQPGEKRLIVRVKVDRLGGIGPKMRPWT